MMDADYEGVLKDLLDKAEHKNSVPKKASRYTAPKDSSDKPDPEVKDQRWAHKKPNAFRKPHRGNFNGSFESLDSSPTPERQHKFFQHPNAYNKPKDNSYSSNTESVKAFLEKMFQQHSSMVNTKLNTIMQKVNHFSGEIEKLKNANAELQKNNKTLLKLVLEEKSNSGTVDPQIKNKLASKTAANKQKSTTELEQLLEKTTVINSSNATSSKRVTRSSALKIKKDDSSSDEYVDTESIDPSDELKSDIIRLRKKMDLVASKKDLNNVTKKNLATLAKDLNVTKKDLATGAKKKQSLSKVPEVERLMELVGEKIVFTTGTFSCDKCEKGFIDCNEGDGVILQQCVHTFCRQCIGDHILENKEKDIIDCLYPDCDFSVQESEIQELLSLDEYETRLDQQASNIKDNMEGAEQCRLKGCRGFVVVEKGVFDFVCPVCHHTNCLDCKKIHADGLTCRKLADLTTEEKLRSAENWFALNNDPLITNTENFDCPVCFNTYGVGEGVVLKNCLHVFCKECLKEHVEQSEDVLIKCPHMDEDFSCDDVLQDGEIRALLKPEAFQKYLQRSIKLAESNMKNTFHCLTPDCEHFCIVEDYPNFTCPKCKELNCITCKALHTGKTCRQHAEDLLEKSDGEKQADIQASEAAIQDLIAQGKAMICPNCGAHAMKEVGCDAIMCKCKTELCWATKGRRWGPRGTGDISGGCKCQLPNGGPRCHPNCQNCH